MSTQKPKLVYSTRSDAHLAGKDVQPKVESLPPQQQTIRVRLDKKRRRGKTVTVAEGFQLDPTALKTLQKTLKQFCGAGGTTKGNEIEIQGNHREKVMQKLAALGYKVKRAGG